MNSGRDSGYVPSPTVVGVGHDAALATIDPQDLDGARGLLGIRQADPAERAREARDALDDHVVVGRCDVHAARIARASRSWPRASMKSASARSMNAV